VEGVWSGTLNAGGVSLRLRFHITKGRHGALASTIDSLDQGAAGIPVNRTTFRDGVLFLSADSIRASYEGTLQKDGSILGTWKQGGGALPLSLRRGGGKEEARTPDAVLLKMKEGPGGYWLGTLRHGAMELRVVFKIERRKDGSLAARMDSLDQGAKDIPASAARLDGGRIELEFRTIGGRFQGRLSRDGRELSGEWSQGGGTLPLVLKRQSRAVSVRRPQEPKPPFPYAAREVVCENRAGGSKLAGTLTIPEGAGPFPALLLITGSGQQDRDESLMGHRPFLVLSDYLTRRGIAVLRVDDRGVGGSTGEVKRATSEDFAGDALAAVEFLKSQPGIDPRRIGLAGHSEGGLIAPIAAARSRDVAFLVLMAGTGTTGEQILRRQQALILKADGASEETIRAARRVQEKVFAILRQEEDREVARRRIRGALAASPAPAGGAKGAAADQAGKLTLPWFRFFLRYDPRPTLRQVSCPVLAINGEKDLQVPAEANLREIEKALKEGGNRDVTVRSFPGLNHLFQTCRTGSPAEYGRIEETFAPAALSAIAGWITARFGGRP